MSPEVAADFEAGRRAVAALVESFETDLNYYKSRDFDETTNRQRFLDPFFAALGWDVADQARSGPYADVILEQSLPSERGVRNHPTLEQEEADDERADLVRAPSSTAEAVSVRRPDYTFRIEGAPQFFVEAKRPSVNIASARPIFQVKSYGWSARTALAMLTDFEDLLVFDCRHRPNFEEPNTGRRGLGSRRGPR